MFPGAPALVIGALGVVVLVLLFVIEQSRRDRQAETPIGYPAIEIVGGRDNEIRDNRIESFNAGIRVENSPGTTIGGNVIAPLGSPPNPHRDLRAAIQLVRNEIANHLRVVRAAIDAGGLWNDRSLVAWAWHGNMADILGKSRDDGLRGSVDEAYAEFDRLNHLVNERASHRYTETGDPMIPDMRVRDGDALVRAVDSGIRADDALRALWEAL